MSKKSRRSNSGSTPRPGAANFSANVPPALPRVAFHDDLDSFDSPLSPAVPAVPSLPNPSIPSYGQRSKARSRLSPHPASPLVVKPRRYGQQPRLAKTIQISAPRKVLACLRRRRRREVLFALKRAGRRGSAPGPYRRTKFSSYSC